ncbi:ABC transporter substrate-binding protein [Ideonella livida]|uniref:ABC transporter substrate-binding protein n=1 Tax=Ideonella livida TaxID=2707176 RepID=A0A7C9PET0_9BURK|nr:ABC transporter substrate-binding protein [Ideonella livida]NDY89791.1 ABC transporter substrate-binding protein [Ideonella livida]
MPKTLPPQAVRPAAPGRLWRCAALAGSLMAGSPAALAQLTVLQVAPLTGVDGGLGYHVRLGAQIAFDEANAQDPVPGGPVSLLTLDEQRGQVVQQVRQALARQPVALFGLVGRHSVQELAQGTPGGWLTQWQLPLVGVFSGSVQALAPLPAGVVLTRGSYADEVESVFRHLGTIASRRVALVTTDDADGEEVSALVRQQAQAEKVGLLGVHTHPTGSAEVMAAAQTLAGQGVDAVILASNTAAVANFAKLYTQAGGRAQLIALSSAEATQLAAVVGPQAARGVLISQLVPNPRDPKRLLSREFLAAYKRWGPADLSPTLAMTESYIAARLLLDSLRRSGPRPTAAGVWRTLAGLPPQVQVADLPVAVNRRAPGYRSLSMIGRDGALVY